jgi:hypothetical protein
MSSPDKDGLGPLHERIRELMDVALEDPLRALEEIRAFERLLADSGANDSWGVHYLYFLAHGKLAANAVDQQGNEHANEIIACSERALSEYRVALTLAQYETQEPYDQTIVVKPAGLFRNAQTETRRGSRTVTRNHVEDLGVDGRLVDCVAGQLEERVPGRVHDLLGKVKVKHLAKGGRVSVASGIRNFAREDVLALNEVWLSASKPVRAAMVGLIGEGPTLIFTLFEQPDWDERGDPQCSGTCLVKKEHGEWRRIL